MNNILFLSSVVIILSIFIYRYLSKFGVPMLLVFISLGMIFGVMVYLKFLMIIMNYLGIYVVLL